MKTVYLDGVLTDSTEIDPAKHLLLVCLDHQQQVLIWVMDW
jgi:hypothetical protein